MNNPLTHTINSRELTVYHPIQSELALDKQKNYLFDLSYLGVLDFTGEKSVDFLQGQLTCDLRLLSNTRIVQGAQCNLQGRILSLVDIIQWNGVKTLLPKDLLEATARSLSKTAMLSRVTIKENTQIRVLGFYLQNNQDYLPIIELFSNEVYAQNDHDSCCYYHLGKGFYIILVPEEKIDSFTSHFITHNQFLGSLTWHTLMLFNKHLSIYPESRGLFLPHRLDLHHTSLVSFNKGCFKGQEIIARMHYRATMKHELKLYQIQTDHAVYSGQKVFKEDGNVEVGELIDYSCLGDNRYLIALSILKDFQGNVRFEQHNRCTQLELV